MRLVVPAGHGSVLSRVKLGVAALWKPAISPLWKPAALYFDSVQLLSSLRLLGVILTPSQRRSHALSQRQRRSLGCSTPRQIHLAESSLAPFLPDFLSEARGCPTTISSGARLPRNFPPCSGLGSPRPSQPRSRAPCLRRIAGNCSFVTRRSNPATSKKGHGRVSGCCRCASGSPPASNARSNAGRNTPML